MKKLLLIVALLFASYGAFADEFDDIVAAMRQTSHQTGWKVRSNRATRTITFDIKLPPDVQSASPKDLADFKEAFVPEFRKSAGPRGVALIKRNRVTMVFRLILTNGRIYRVVVRPHEF